MNAFEFFGKVSRSIRYAREQGWLSLLNLVHRKLFSGDVRAFAKTDVIGFYNFVNGQKFGPEYDQGCAPKDSLNWFIPPFSKGSGGHLNIFRFISNLEKAGFECRVIVVGEPRPLSSSQTEREIREWFFPLNAKVYIGVNSVPVSHISIATSWQTAYFVKNFRGSKHKCYFVQDFEPWFYAAGSESAFAEETYRFGFVGITAGTWLAEKLATEYGMKTYSVGFSYDKDRYRQLERREPDIRRVFFYARPPTPRRAFELGLLVLDEVTRRLPDVHVIFAGWDLSGYSIPFVHLNAGVLSLDELPDVYSQCDVALVLSFSNLSLLPLEMMACGTPVVSNCGPFAEWLLNDKNARLASPTVESLANAVCDVLENKELSESLRSEGFATALKTSWADEASKMADILRDLH